MLNWLKWLIAPSEMAELERWRIACEYHSRWLAEFEIVPETLSRVQSFAERNAIAQPLSDTRAKFRAIAQTARGHAEDAERYRYVTRTMGAYCIVDAAENMAGVLKAGAADAAIDAARTQEGK